jgi:hypothetical protein
MISAIPKPTSNTHIVALMKIMLFNDYRIGIIKGEGVVDITSVVSNIPHRGVGNLMNELIPPDLKRIAEWGTMMIEYRLNNRPRKLLGF